MKERSDVTLDEFITKAKADPHYAAYLAKFGSRTDRMNLTALYDMNLRKATPAGTWSSANGADYNRAQPATTLLQVPAPQMAAFDTFLTEQLRQDPIKAAARETYLAQLRADAAAGNLRPRLLANTLAEATYYAAPAIAPADADAERRLKAIAFAVGYPGAPDAAQSPFRDSFDTFRGLNAAFPISSISVANGIWRKVVAGAPVYRAVNILQPTNYPSSIAGDFVLAATIANFNTTANPANGDNLWYDWALYFFAATMTCQAFTDGNKRVARLIYGLVLDHGGVPFIAPNGTLGAQLADM